jgi:hypothetical protein
MSFFDVQNDILDFANNKHLIMGKNIYIYDDHGWFKDLFLIF